MSIHMYCQQKLAATKKLKGSLALLLTLLTGTALAQDLAEIQQRGSLRHIGIPYAHFVAGDGVAGLDTEVMHGFAQSLGVRYEYVPSQWESVIADLTGQNTTLSSQKDPGKQGIRGDIIANGLTILPPRQALIDYSTPTFPSAVWLVSAAHSKIIPIQPGSDQNKDIAATKQRLSQGKTLVMKDSCLDPALYKLTGKGLKFLYHNNATNLNEVVPLLIKGKVDMALLEMPDILIAMQKWPGEIKVIGPISETQALAVGFRKSSPELRQAFNTYFGKLVREGRYLSLVEKYYPGASRYFPAFFGPMKLGKLPQ